MSSDASSTSTSPAKSTAASSSSTPFKEDAASLTASLANLTVSSPPKPSVASSSDADSTSAASEASAPLTLEIIASRIASKEITRIAFMTGAGCSTSAGIPDFRTPGTGLYDNLQKYNLPNPTAIFTLDYFRQNPQPFYLLAKELYPGAFRPTITHWFIRALEERGVLLKVWTQNIDSLEELTGLSPSSLIQAHGGFAQAHCIDCEKEFSPDYVKQHVFEDKIPRCTECNGYIKPDITFFGEGLPEYFEKSIMKDLPQADLLIVAGTSLVVQPFASLTGRVSATTPRILINNEAVGEMASHEFLMRTNSHYASLKDALDHMSSTNPMYPKLQAMVKQYRGKGFDFHAPESLRRDFFLKGSCDEMCLKLARMIDPELEKRVREMEKEDKEKHGGKKKVEEKQAEEKSEFVKSVIAAEASIVASSSSSSAVSAAASTSSPSSSSTATTSSSSPIAIGFDFDHTLGLDHSLELRGVESYFSSVFPSCLKFVGVDTEEAKKTKEKVETELKKYRDGHCSQEVMLRAISTALGHASEEDHAKLNVEVYRAACMKFVSGTTEIEGAKEMLRWLRSQSIPYAILTNGWSPLQEKKIHHVLGEELTPENVLVSEVIQALKPDKKAFDALVALPGFKDKSRSNILYVGDNPSGDIVGAMNSGLIGVWLDAEKVAYPQGEKKPDCTIHKLSELKQFVEKIKQNTADKAKL